MTLEATTTVTREHHQAIARTIQDYTQQLNASNTRAIVDLHSDDAVMFQPDQPTALGTQQLTAAYERAFSGVRCSFTSHIDEILTDGDLASVGSHRSGTVTLLADGAVVPQECRELWVLRRSGGAGACKIAQCMFQQVRGAF